MLQSFFKSDHENYINYMLFTGASLLYLSTQKDTGFFYQKAFRIGESFLTPTFLSLPILLETRKAKPFSEMNGPTTRVFAFIASFGCARYIESKLSHYQISPTSWKLASALSFTPMIIKMIAYCIYSKDKLSTEPSDSGLSNPDTLPSSPQCSKPESKQSVEAHEELEALRREVLDFYKIPATKFPRRYPNITICDTCRCSKISFLDADKLTEKLQAYAKRNNISIGDIEDRYFTAALIKYISIIFPELSNISTEGAHGYGNSYSDKDILKVHKVTKSITVTDSQNTLKICYTKHNKPIIQQQATRGCTAAVTAMLIYEKRQSVDINKLNIRNLGNDSDQEHDIKAAGLTPLTSKCSSLEELKRLIEKDGSAIVSVSSIGGHVIVVDEVLDDRVRIRDPYHGWEVDLKKEAFLLSWGEGQHSVMQIAT